MSWSVKVTGKPQEALAKFTEYAVTSWGYTHSGTEKENIDQVLVYLAQRMQYFGGNEVPTTFVELEGVGHWDDNTGQGNVSVKVTVFSDRRKT